VKPRARYVRLNPSTADADSDDATIRSCIRLAKGLGYGSFEVVNLFAFRRPTRLIWQLPPSRQASTMTDRSNGQMARCDIAICAWCNRPMAERRDSTMCGMIRQQRPAAFRCGAGREGRCDGFENSLIGLTPIWFLSSRSRGI